MYRIPGIKSKIIAERKRQGMELTSQDYITMAAHLYKHRANPLVLEAICHPLRKDDQSGEYVRKYQASEEQSLSGPGCSSESSAYPKSVMSYPNDIQEEVHHSSSKNTNLFGDEQFVIDMDQLESQQPNFAPSKPVSQPCLNNIVVSNDIESSLDEGQQKHQSTQNDKQKKKTVIVSGNSFIDAVASFIATSFSPAHSTQEGHSLVSHPLESVV